MDDKSPDRSKAQPSLAAALRSARAEAAERSQAMADLRGAEAARLDLLRENLEPVLAQVPPDVDVFDTGMVPGEHPRLFIDMIAFVDMARDRHTYRFHLDTRHGRVLLAETDSIAVMIGAITDYIARRLVEREKALASLVPGGPVLTLSGGEAAAPPPEAPVPVPFARPGAVARTIRALRLGIEGVGLLALIGLVWLGLRHWKGLGPW